MEIQRRLSKIQGVLLGSGNHVAFTRVTWQPRLLGACQIITARLQQGRWSIYDHADGRGQPRLPRDSHGGAEMVTCGTTREFGLVVSVKLLFNMLNVR